MTASARKVLVVGGTSDIGRAVAFRYAKAGWNVTLTYRDPEAGAREVADIQTRTGAVVNSVEFDILRDGQDRLVKQMPVLPDTLICVIGDLGSQTLAETDPNHTVTVLRTNFEGPVLLLTAYAEMFRQRGSGTLIGISSVAGNRGRASNYVYGAAKAGLSAFLSGLRARLHKSGVRVVTVKPGFVRTRMTAGMKLPPLLTAEPQEVADAIFLRGERGGADVLYVRKVWAPIMTVIGAIPEFLFKRLPL